MNLGILILAVVTAFAGSCAPVHSVKRYGISATLTDRSTDKPISKTPVVITIDNETFKRTTDQEGVASVGPDRKLRMSWLGGPAIQSDPEARITVSCTGYGPLDIEWFRSLPHRNSGRIEDLGVIELGKLAMVKTKGQRTPDGHANLEQELDDAPKVPVKPPELPEGITLSDASLKVDVLQILVQRGGKDPKDRWIVDLFKGDIRIRKSRTDNTVYPPGASVEFWRKESNGGWRRLPTA